MTKDEIELVSEIALTLRHAPLPNAQESIATFLALIDRLARVEEKAKAVSLAWSKSWDCSADPGHRLMDNAIVALGIALDGKEAP